MTLEQESTILAEAQDGWQPFRITGTRQCDMRSRNGRSYRIFVSIPAEQPPASGYPVFYVLDANAVFATVVDAVRVQGRRPEKTGVSPAVIVGIGYQTDVPFASDRFYDFTVDVPTSELPVHPDGIEWPEQGERMHFYRS